jgi:hypothetical protein
VVLVVLVTGVCCGARKSGRGAPGSGYFVSNLSVPPALNKSDVSFSFIGERSFQLSCPAGENCMFASAPLQPLPICGHAQPEQGSVR